ncbi:hypothetical protein DP117_16515 [Brasilonema sp. UFV-L1]|nr:hypothetical protein [Brasilonema sp. UFV-L1]
MKRLIVGSLSLLLISTVGASVVRAESSAYNPAVSGKTPSYVGITPFNLVNLAYQGQLQDQGIPSYQDLISAYQAKQISAEDIVRSAVQSKKLPSQLLSDKAYLNAVKTQLDSFRTTQNY